MVDMERVVAYGRVSTQHEQQFYSFDNQVQYYDGIISQHDDWKLYKRYLDRGITGTSTKKRKGFLDMIRDAENGSFDILITREVSRFARNVKDSIVEVCKLVDLGIRVIFIADDIDTERDSNWKEKLVYCAMNAENQSKKTSEIVRLGQETSRKNGVIYGTGNVLGYDRVGKEFIVNVEQAKIVRLIFDMYLRGSGSRQIQYELERNEYLTATGKKNWDPSTITRILRNPLYCGRVVYNKYYVESYLHQQPKINKGAVEQTIIEDRVEAIVSKEEFNRVQELLDSHKTHNSNVETKVGKPPVTIFGKKLVCCCGYSMQKKTYRKYEDHTAWCYQCYDQVNRGSYTSRKKNGVSVDGICDTKIIADWKLKLISYIVFDMLIENQEEIISNIDILLQSSIEDEKFGLDDEQKYIEKEIERLERKASKLLDTYLDDNITQCQYTEKKKEIDSRLNDYNVRLEEIKANTLISPKTIQERLEECKETIRNGFVKQKGETYEKLVDSFVKRIVVGNDHIEWHMTLFGKNDDSSNKCHNIIEKKEIMIGKLAITKDDATTYSKYNDELSRVYLKEPLMVEVYI